MFEFSDDPFLAFQGQFDAAKKAGIQEPTAMSLATASRAGFPSVRVVLYKGLLENKFSFYTNYESQKSHELKENPRASLLFYWPELGQQIRIDGQVHVLTRTQNEEYFATRPRDSQIGAWASEQSREIPNFEWLARRVQKYTEQFIGMDVPCPPNWGGYALEPAQIEFWFAREGRLHERYVYSRAVKSPLGETVVSKTWRKFYKSS